MLAERVIAFRVGLKLRISRNISIATAQTDSIASTPMDARVCIEPTFDVDRV